MMKYIKACGYYPQEMTEALRKAARVDLDSVDRESVENALYNLKAMTDNSYNDKRYRVLYTLLAHITEVSENDLC